MAKFQRTTEIFEEGQGRPFNVPSRGPIEKGPRDRDTSKNAKVIDLDDLEKPGRGPCNFVRKNGMKMVKTGGYYNPKGEPEED